MHALTGSGWAMVAVGAVLGLLGVFLLVRLHAFDRETPKALAGRIAGTMLTMLGLLLIVFAIGFASQS